MKLRFKRTLTGKGEEVLGYEWIEIDTDTIRLIHRDGHLDVVVSCVVFHPSIGEIHKETNVIDDINEDLRSGWLVEEMQP
jgi:hypothetical protein